MDNSEKHNKVGKELIFKIGDLVTFTPDAYNVRPEDRTKVWIIGDYVNKKPEEFSVYDYVLTNGYDEIVAIEYELRELEEK